MEGEKKGVFSQLDAKGSQCRPERGQRKRGASAKKKRSLRKNASSLKELKSGSGKRGKNGAS